MKVSFAMFGLDLREYASLAVLGEQLGYDGIWLGDHLVHPTTFRSKYPYNGTGDVPYSNRAPVADVWVTIGHLAALTSTLNLGPGVLILPLRPVLVTAQAVATAQALSGGRVQLGVGAGWLRQEFEAAGMGFDDRGARTDEYIDALRLLGTGEPTTFDGTYVQLDDVALPPALDPQAPIIVGGTSAPALRRAAQRGDGWLGMAGTLDDAVAAHDRIERLRAGAGRSDLPFAYYPRVPEPEDGSFIERFEEAGFDRLVVSLNAMRGSATADDRRQAVEHVAGLCGLTPT